MADPVAWGMLDDVGEKVDGVNSNVQNIAVDVNNAMNNGLGELDIKGNQLVEHVKNETAAMKDAIESASSGNPPPNMQRISSASTDAGIDVTYTVNAVKGYGESNANPLSTKGVMVRYSDVSYPKTIHEGNLGFIDEDVVTVNQEGVLSGKQKTNKIVGLTNGKTYYITAFPFTHAHAYNDSLGTTNCTKCAWTGTKSTLSINVGTNSDLFSLGEYTITLTPLSGGAPIQKTKTGKGTVVFSDIEGAMYILSFGDVSKFDKPNNQTIELISGVPKVLNINYTVSGNLNKYKWSEIKQLLQTGQGGNLFSIGATKEITIPNVGQINMILSHIKGEKAYFTSKELLPECSFHRGHIPENGICYTRSDVKTYIEQTVYNSFEQDLKDSIVEREMGFVNAGYGDDKGESPVQTLNCKIWIPFLEDIGLTANHDYSTAHGDTPVKLSYYTNAERRKKRNLNGDFATYWTATLYLFYVFSQGVVYIDTQGSFGWTTPDDGQYGDDGTLNICFGFCI